MVLFPLKLKEKTKSGLYLTDETIAESQVTTNICKVLKIGDLCFKDETKFPSGPWCKKGDWKPSYLFSYGPLFELPFRPFIILKWIFSHPGYILPWLFFYGLIGLIVYLFLTPDLEVTSNLHYSWCLPILLRNFILILLWFGSLDDLLFLDFFLKIFTKFSACLTDSFFSIILLATNRALSRPTKILA